MKGQEILLPDAKNPDLAIGIFRFIYINHPMPPRATVFFLGKIYIFIMGIMFKTQNV